MKKVCDTCTGCGLCAEKCGQNAIKMKKNSIGEDIAIIQEKWCVNCGLCKKICPESSPVNKAKSIKCFAAWSKDYEIYSSTTSGGIATVAAKNIISKGGVVYGAALLPDLSVKHIRINAIKDLDKIKGSKYVQSYIHQCYKEILTDITEGRKVLFIGTPCQVAAVKRLVGVADNLYLIDLVCHGTPPQTYFQEYIKRFKLEFSDDNKITFRNKRYWLSILKNGKCIYKQRYNKDPYFEGFMDNLIMRENCYKCQYSNEERCGDITLGDFWGLERNRMRIDYPEFVSCVLINNEKGKAFFKEFSEQCEYGEHSIQEAVSGNHNLKKTSIRPGEKDKFNKYYKAYGFESALASSSVHKRIRKAKVMDVVLVLYRLFKYGIHYKKLM